MDKAPVASTPLRKVRRFSVREMVDLGAGRFHGGLLSVGVGLRHANLDVAVGDLVAVVLQQDMTVGPFTVAGDVLEFAQGDEFAEGRRTTLVFEDLRPVEPMFDVGTTDEDAGRVPFANGIRVFGRRCGLEIVERGDGAVAIAAQLGIRMQFVIKNLIFQSDGRTRGRFGAGAGDGVEVGLAEIFDAAVRSRGDFEIQHQFKLRIAFLGDDVAALGRFCATARQHGQYAVFDFPALGRKCVQSGATPAGSGFAVPQEFPAAGLFGLAQGIIGRGSRSRRSGLGDEGEQERSQQQREGTGGGHRGRGVNETAGWRAEPQPYGPRRGRQFSFAGNVAKAIEVVGCPGPSFSSDRDLPRFAQSNGFHLTGLVSTTCRIVFCESVR